MADAEPVNILALDGGGVRGLSELLILDSLMGRLKNTNNLRTNPRPCEVFDLICGTSTGGLIALMLGRLRMDVQQAIKCYCNLSEKIFGHKRPFAWYQRLSGSAMYDASILEQCIKDVAADIEGAEGNAPLEDPRGTDACCRTFVLAVTKVYADAPPRRFRSYGTRTRSADRCKIWEAARATTAAVSFFEAMTMGEPPQTFIDGAFAGANNPSQIAREEASDVFPGRPLGCFLSLGTGVPNVVSVKGNLAKIAEACAKLISSCEGVDHAVSRDFRKETPKNQMNPYFRFSVDRGLETITLDEWGRVQELTAITNQYMELNAQDERAERCVQALKLRATKVHAQHEEAAALL